MALLVTGGALTAAAAPEAVARTTVQWATPTAGADLSGTVDLAVTGTHLRSVHVYKGVTLLARLTVDAGGSSAHGEFDTSVLRDGPATLTARAVGDGRTVAARRDVAVAGVRIANAGADSAPPGAQLVFSDEFSGRELDRSLWCTRYMYDGGPELQVPDVECLGTDPETGATLGTLDTLGGNGQEDEVYRDWNVDGEPMHTVQNGYLTLRATHTRPADTDFPYESAMIRSKQEFQPTGEAPLYLTARVRMPEVQGSWPAFWLTGGYGTGEVRPPWPPEIDILEGALNIQDDGVDMLHFGTITNVENPPQGSQEWFEVSENFDTRWGNYRDPEGASLRERWLEVGLEWHTDHVCWFVDGVKATCQQYSWVANQGITNPAAVLLNLAVGGPWAGRYGVDDAAFPIGYDIDHVRIYRF